MSTAAPSTVPEEEAATASGLRRPGPSADGTGGRGSAAGAAPPAAGPALLAGVGLALSLPPWGFWVLAFPSAGLLWWRLGGLGPRTRLWAGWLAGLGLFVPGLAWARSFTLPGRCAHRPRGPRSRRWRAWPCRHAPWRRRALAFPAAMTLAEAVRMTWPFGGLPIGGVFLGQAGGPVLGVARLGGPFGLTPAVYVGGVAVGGAGRAGAARRDRGSTSPSRGRPGWWAGRCRWWWWSALAVGAAAAPDGGPRSAPSPRPPSRAAGPGASEVTGRPGHRPCAPNWPPPTASRRPATATGRLVLWPEDVVSLDHPAGRLAGGGGPVGAGRPARTPRWWSG